MCVDSPAGCDRIGFSINNDSVSHDAAPGIATYAAQSTHPTTADLLRIEVYNSPEAGGATAPGDYSLDGLNYADCGNCVLIYSDCDGLECGTVFFADEGTLELASTPPADENLSGVLTGVKLKEVTIASDFTTSPIPGGEVWCLDGVTF